MNRPLFFCGGVQVMCKVLCSHGLGIGYSPKPGFISWEVLKQVEYAFLHQFCFLYSMVAKRRRHRSGSFTSGPKKTLERRMSLQIDDKGKLLLVSLILFLR